MRILVLSIFMVIMSPVLAITKCELNGKVTYKQGGCPENATTKYLVKDKYVAESQLQQHQQVRNKQSQEAFKKMNTPIKRPDYSDEEYESETLPTEPKKVQMSNESAHFQLQQAGKQIESSENLNAKLSEMEQQLEQQKKELQKLEQ